MRKMENATLIPNKAKSQTVSSRIAQSFRDKISSGQLHPGDRIPSERELAQQLGVARSGVREALQQLRSQGYLVAGRGRKGTTVASLSDQVAAQSFAGLLVQEASGLADLYEFSLSLQVEAVGLAALRRLPEDLIALDEIVAEMQRRPERIDADLDVAFHITIVRAAHNIFYTRVINELIQILHENMPMILEILYTDTSSSQKLLAQHAAIANAVRNRDAQGAREATVEHIQWAFREIFRIESQNRFSQWPQHDTPLPPAAFLAPKPEKDGDENSEKITSPHRCPGPRRRVRVGEG